MPRRMGVGLGAVAGWAIAVFACAGVAAGRGIPVHRDYTVPILFHGAEDAATADTGLSPDQAERKRFIFEQGQAAMIGREPLIALMPEESQVTGAGALLALSEGRMASPNLQYGLDGARAKKKESGMSSAFGGRMWIMPSLGGGGSNSTATTLFGVEEGEGWGWLADAVGEGIAEGTGSAEETLEDLTGDTEGATSGFRLPGGGAVSPQMALGTSPKREAETGAGAEGMARAPERDLAGGAATETDRSPEALAMGGGTDRAGASGAEGRRVLPEAGGMPKTRKMLDELSARLGGRVEGLRPDAERAVGSASWTVRGAEPASTVGSWRGDAAERTAGGGTVWGGGGEVRSAGMGMGSGASFSGGAVSHWQGGWSAGSASGSAGGIGSEGGASRWGGGTGMGTIFGGGGGTPAVGAGTSSSRGIQPVFKSGYTPAWR